jgi:GNAT superfamily N-acetyltransferase
VSEAILLQNTVGNFCYRPGDGLVALRRGRVVGFGLGAGGQGPASVLAVLVDPELQRRGIGRALIGELAARMRAGAASEVRLGPRVPALYYFWPGVPEDLDEAMAFFGSLGARWEGRIWDLSMDIVRYRQPPEVERTLQRERVEIGPVQEGEIPALLAFEEREFPGWSAVYRHMVGCGDWPRILVVRKRGEILGTVATYSAESGYRAANLNWENPGEGGTAGLGGFGAVGVAAGARGRGLGLALCAAAVQRLRRSGVRMAVVDWTSLSGFYERLGFRVSRRYRSGVLPGGAE